MTQEKSKPKSKEESAQQESDSVYDFLYHDARRVGSFLGQFDPDGHLLGVQTNAETGRSSRNRVAAGGTGGVPLVASVTGNTEMEETERWDRKGQRTFDPLWGNALAFLDYLTQRDLLVRNLSEARIGQIALIGGTLSILDLKMLQEAWKTKSVKETIMNGAAPQASGNRNQRRASGNSLSNKGMDPAFALMFDMLPIMPHMIQASLWTGTKSVWATLSDDALVTTASALTLAHGSRMSGRWHMLGILDALPDSESEQDLGAETIATPIAQAAAALAPATKSLMGRPSESYAMTPILIFREVSGASGGRMRSE